MRRQGLDSLVLRCRSAFDLALVQGHEHRIRVHLQKILPFQVGFHECWTKCRNQVKRGNEREYREPNGCP